MSSVTSVTLQRVFDSRGQPTVEASVTTHDGGVGRAAAPSGASTGRHEVQAFPDGGVPTALARFATDVRPRLLGRDAADQAGWDATLRAIDATPKLARIGGNTATALSVAVAIARANELGRPLVDLWRRPGVPNGRFPAIVGNCLNGGRHAIGGPEFQEFLAFAPGDDPSRSIPAALAVHQAVGHALQERFPGAAIGRGDEGGWVAPLDNVAALEILAEACRGVRSRLGAEVYPALDCAASEFYRDGAYRYRDRTLDVAAQRRFLAELVASYDVRYLEDPLEEESFADFAKLTADVGSRTLVIGDDLYTTDLGRVRTGIAARATNAVLIKVNQIGTVTDALATVDATRAAGWSTITSHRSGDVPEGWLAHFAVATGAAGLKCGLLGGERVAKLNELLRLAPSLGA